MHSFPSKVALASFGSHLHYRQQTEHVEQHVELTEGAVEAFDKLQQQQNHMEGGEGGSGSDSSSDFSYRCCAQSP